MNKYKKYWLKIQFPTKQLNTSVYKLHLTAAIILRIRPPCQLYSCQFNHLVSKAPLTKRLISLADPIDIVTDPIAPHEYKAEEDPRFYKSVKTQRGPLRDDWIEEYNNNPGKTPIMCAYKLCKVEFRYWGMQSKIERFIHDVGE